jgi:hypothetical protein
MKKFHKYFLPLLLVVLIAFVTGCKKDDDDDEPPTFEGFSLTEEEIIDRIPVGLLNSSNENAQACVDAIESAADWSAFYSDLIPPAGAVKVSSKSTSSEGTWKWTQPYEGHTISFYWTYEETATKYIWTMEIQFDDSPRYGYIEAWELKDGTQGEVRYNFQWICFYNELYYEEYNEDCEDLYWVYTWTMNPSGVINYTFIWETSDTEYLYFLKYELVLNPDGSGTLDYYSVGAFDHWHYEWDALGNGTWVWYTEGTEVSGSGSWTV